MALDFLTAVDDDEDEKKKTLPTPLGKTIYGGEKPPGITAGTPPPSPPTQPPPAQPQPTSQPIGKPIGPQVPSPVPVGSGEVAPASIGSPIRPTPPVQDVSTPPNPQPTQPDTSQTIGSPISPTVSAPRSPRPEYHGFNRFLDTLAGATKIGSAIEGASGLGTEGWRVRNADEERQVEQGEKERLAPATQAETQGRADEAEARAKAAEAGSSSVMITLPNGQIMSIPQSALGSDVRALITQQGAGQRTEATNKTREDIANIEAENKLAVQAGKPPAHQVVMQNGKPIIMGWNPQTKQYDQPEGEAPPNYAEIAPSLKTVDIVSPTTGVPTITTLGGREVGTSATGPMAGMGLMAGTVMQQIPRIKEEVARLRDKFGPLAGRWNELYANKIGANDPEFTGLDSDLDLLASAIVRTHFGARGGAQYREALRKQFGEAQTADDLISRIDHADQWIEGYAKMGQAHPAGGGNAPAPAAGGGTPSFDEFQRSRGR